MPCNHHTPPWRGQQSRSSRNDKSTQHGRTRETTKKPENSTTQQLLTEISDAEPRLHLSIHDLNEDSVLAAQYRVDKAPMIVVASKNGEKAIDLGVQFAGIPAGYEFTTLVNDILLASKGTTVLGAATREFLQTLTKPLHLQVFVTPT